MPICITAMIYDDRCSAPRAAPYHTGTGTGIVSAIFGDDKALETKEGKVLASYVRQPKQFA
jgi:hypothetical protein